MKKITPEVVAKMTILALASVVTLPIMLFIVNPLIMEFFIYEPVKDVGTGIGLLSFSAAIWLFIKAIICLLAIKLNIYHRLLLHYKKNEEKSMLRKILKENEKKQEYSAAKDKMKKGYTIERVYPADKPLVFILRVTEPVYTNLVPIVSVNNVVSSVQVVNSHEVACFLEKNIAIENEVLKFATEESGYEIKNPYFFINTKDPVVWQCEGHGYERVILLSKSYLPNTMEKVIYPFTLYVGGKLVRTFHGVYTPAKQVIVISLEKDVHKSQCAGKDVTLVPAFGKRNKILLPAPQVITKEGVQVLV